MHKIKILKLWAILFCISLLHGDSIHSNLDFKQWQKGIKFGIPKKACATCNFIIMTPQDDATLESLLQDSDITPNTYNNGIQDTHTISQKDLLALQNSAMQDLFDSNTNSQDETTYDFLGQRQSIESYNNLLGTSQLNTAMPYKNPNNFIKAVFMKSTIATAYQEILRHKGVLTCMYCGDLDKAFKELPQRKTQLNINGVQYSYTPNINYNSRSHNQNSYEITISDKFCGMRDNLVFIQDGASVELWLYSRMQC